MAWRSLRTIPSFLRSWIETRCKDSDRLRKGPNFSEKSYLVLFVQVSVISCVLKPFRRRGARHWTTLVTVGSVYPGWHKTLLTRRQPKVFQILSLPAAIRIPYFIKRTVIVCCFKGDRDQEWGSWTEISLAFFCACNAQWLVFP